MYHYWKTLKSFSFAIWPAIGSIHGNHHHTSLREQLQFTSGISQTSSVNVHGAPRSLFNKLGIRKPSILSLGSPNPSGGAAARTFSLDDLLRPPPRCSSSPRKKRNNSTPVKKNAVEKRQILQHLVLPINRSLKSETNIPDTLILSHTQLQRNTDKSISETTFTSSINPLFSRKPVSDSKLEKKVTFARMLNKLSAEMSSGSEIDGDNGTRNSSTLSLHSELQFRASSVPLSPCTNDIKSPQSTSSIKGNDSASSIYETTIDSMKTKNNFNINNRSNNKRVKSKVSSADSILSIFKNLASSSPTSFSLPSTSIYMSPSVAFTVSSSQDDVVGDDESSTSSLQAPVSFSIGPPDSPVFYKQKTIEVPVLDVINAHKSKTNTSFLQPPTVLLEIPNSGISKCLSPIRELPTPMPSPSLTPIMPRVNKNEPFLTTHKVISNYDKKSGISIINQFGPQFVEHQLDTQENNKIKPTQITKKSFANRDQLDNVKGNLLLTSKPKTHSKMILPTDEKLQRPRNLIIPTLVVEQASPTKN